MSGLYERIELLCKRKNMRVGTLCTELGWSRSTLTELRTGRTKSLSAKKIQEIADYFGVSTDVVLGIENTPTNSDESIKANRIKLMLSDASEEELDFIIRFLELRGK